MEKDIQHTSGTTKMEFKDIPWKDVLIDTRDYTVFRDGFPVTPGHILFVPKQQDWTTLEKCYKAAYSWGYDWVQGGNCDAFNLGQNVGEAAGQTVMWPHVHLIPRRYGDMENPKGGVRGVIPEKQKYTPMSNDQMEMFEENVGC